MEGVTQNLDHEIQVPKISENVSIWFFGDQHYGSSACAVGEMDATIQEIAADPNGYAILMGDFCDFINFTDKRFDVRSVEPDLLPHLDDLPRRSADALVEHLRPLRGDKIICAIPGNHDEKIRLRYHFDVAGYITGVLGVSLLSVVAQLRLRVRDKHHSYEVKGVLSHAEKGATTVGGKLTATERMSDYYGNHDFFAQAHLHEYLVFDGRNMDVAGEFQHKGSPKTVERPRLTILTGGYLKTYAPGVGGYGERRGYRPTRLGSPRLMMRMNRTTDKVELRGI